MIERLPLVQEKLISVALENQNAISGWLSERHPAKETLHPSLLRLAQETVAPFSNDRELVRL